MFPDPTEKSSGTLKVRAGVLRERKKNNGQPMGGNEILHYPKRHFTHEVSLWAVLTRKG